MKLVFLSLMLSTLTAGAQSFNFNSTSFEKGDTMIVYGLSFDLDDYRIKKDMKPFLDSLHRFMQEYPFLSIEIGVHSDEKDCLDCCYFLTRRRANSIAKYLNIDRVRAKGYEGSHPLIVGAKTEEEHQKNRRVEIKIIEHIEK